MRIIAGEARGRRLQGPEDKTIRPLLDRVRESLFQRLGQRFVNGMVLDLFAGTGSFGLEALSRGAARAVFVDLDPRALALVRANVAHLGFDNRCEVLAGSALEVPDLRAPPAHGNYSLVFLDPPFKMLGSRVGSSRVMRRVEEALDGDALADGGTVILRVPADSGVSLPPRPHSSRRYGESTVYFF